MQLLRAWFPAFFAGSLAFAGVLTLVVQSRSKWAVVQRIHGWPGVQQTLHAVGWALAWWEFRRLRTSATRPQPRQPPPSQPP
jgi:protein-S-isoprenylcysteine O-methyltransferase Ste14